MGLFIDLLMIAASLVFVWGVWFVLREKYSKLRGKRGDVTTARLMHKAADIAVSENRLTATLEAQRIQPIFEIIHTVSRIPGREIVLVRNAGGVASNTTVETSNEITIEVHPRSFGPDDEVQFTMTNTSEDVSSVEFELSYLNTAGATESIRFQYDKAASTIRAV